MKKTTKLPRLLLCIALTMQMASCGLLEFDLEDIGDLDESIAIEMSLNYDTIYALPGDTMSIQAAFAPDTLNINSVLITSTDTSVVRVQDGKVEAVGLGECKIYIEPVSVLKNIVNRRDSVTIFVFDLWKPTQRVYPYETVFYATARVDGRTLNDEMSLYAFVPLPNFSSSNPFVGFECRGVGQAINHQYANGVMQLRVGADEIMEDDDWEDPVEYEYETDEDGNPILDENGDPIVKTDEQGNPIVVEEDDALGVGKNTIIFRLYDRRVHQLYTATKQVDFDGETYGSLSRPYLIEFESYAYQQAKKKN